MIRFDTTQENIERLKEHAQREGTKTALDTIYEKLLKSEGRNVRRLSIGLDDIINFQDTKPRDPATGSYSGNAEGGPNANDMATVYKMPQPQPQTGVSAGQIGKAGAAVFGAGALGAIGASAGKASWAQGRALIKHLAAKRKSLIHKP